jgi:cyanate lyase
MAASADAEHAKLTAQHAAELAAIKKQHAAAKNEVRKKADAAITSMKEEAEAVAASINLHTCIACEETFFDDDVGCVVGDAIGGGDRCGTCAKTFTCSRCNDTSCKLDGCVYCFYELLQIVGSFV